MAWEKEDAGRPQFAIFWIEDHTVLAHQPVLLFFVAMGARSIQFRFARAP